ncbi:hypothetical protein GQ43DRAFT_438225 [Delitschia confertaspora ATCC 74209]|uniref:Uncharacterized protein n=1 Tax=Delitschia confertaspora ATCC 74209 TaxID=1513339 RepID=A0A9P4N1T6_9PLEO|nr:hypothetical protein GQ43DRAFT_438225 [Delitschia confertaspora ATCC 74209]
MDAIWKLREKLCSGTFDSTDCNHIDDDGGWASNCYAVADGHEEKQAIMAGPNPAGQGCWDATEKIINYCILGKGLSANSWDRGGLYTYSGNVYFLTIHKGQKI